MSKQSKMRTGVVSIVLVGCGVANTARSAVTTIVSRPPVEGGGTGVFSQTVTAPNPGEFADRFQLVNPTKLVGLKWFGYYANGPSFTQATDFNIRIYADNGGLPASTALAFYSTPVSPVEEAGQLSYLSGIFFTLPAGNFWLAIVESEETQTHRTGLGLPHPQATELPSGFRNSRGRVLDRMTGPSF